MPLEDKIDYFTKLLKLFVYSPTENGSICGEIIVNMVNDKQPEKGFNSIEYAKILLEIAEGVYGSDDATAKSRMAFVNAGLSILD